MFFVTFVQTIFLFQFVFDCFGDPWWIPGNNLFDIVWYKIRHDVEENLSKRFYLPVYIIIKTEVLSPRKRFKASLDCITICSIIMPNGSLMRRWWRNFIVDFTVDYIMMTFGIKGRTCTGLENKIRLIGENKMITMLVMLRSGLLLR